MEKEQTPEWMSCFDQVLKSTSGKQSFLTFDGYLGLACAGAEAGDFIAFIDGGNIPFVMRPARV